MSDVDNQLEKLQAKLAAKTREIEMLVAEERHLGDPNAVQSSSCSFLLSAGAPFSGTSTSFGGPRFRSASLRLRRLAGCSGRRSLF